MQVPTRTSPAARPARAPRKEPLRRAPLDAARSPRAPPIDAVLRVPTDTDGAPDDRPRRRAAAWIGLGTGLVWSGVLLGLLLGLGRVPWPETFLWSALSGLLVGRSAQVGSGRFLAWALAPASVELGMQDPQEMRQRLAAALGRYGYRESRRSLQAERFAPSRLRDLLPPIRVAWSGPGAVVDGPRWLVRVAARLAVG